MNNYFKSYDNFTAEIAENMKSAGEEYPKPHFTMK